jgi:hypothetical protein
MNVFVPDNAKVRVFIDLNGNPIVAKNNIIPDLKVEVVIVPKGFEVDEYDGRLEGSLPFDTFVS